MKVLNLYFTSTGNTEKVALRISETLKEIGYEVDTLRVTGKDMAVDVLKYDFIFAGSGVYGQLPGQPLIDLFNKIRSKSEIMPCSPRRPSAKAVVYSTYGGFHTGIDEAVPTVKYIGQLFDHLGFTIVGEWYIVGEYGTEGLRDRSIGGRLGDISGRPNEGDLRDVAERVRGIINV